MAHHDSATSRRTILTYLVMVVVLVLAIVLTGDELGRHIDVIEAWVATLGPWSIVAYIGLLIVTTSLLMPSTVMSIMAGALFGMAWGIAAVVTGNLLAAALQYTLSRRFLRFYIRGIITARPALAGIQQAVSRNEVKLQMLLRLTPLNPATVSYILGSAGVRFLGFLLACLVHIPNLVIEVYFGYAGKHLARVAGQKTSVALNDLIVIGGLVVTIIVMVLVSRTAYKTVMEAVSKSAAASK
jgi:uncharacterized membrane protein YdjX (TVP38/TMEM64 family)